MISFQACEKKIVNSSKVYKLNIPKELLEVDEINLDRNITNDKDVSLFMLDLFQGYSSCKANLSAIKEINGK